MRYLTLIALVALTGCVGTRMEKGLQSLIGDPISTATSCLGYPDGKREMLGQTIYVWSTDHQSVIMVPTATTTTGQFGGVPYSQTTQGFGMMPIHGTCEIQLATDAGGTIRSYQYRGNPAGCAGYARMLNP